MTEMHYRHHLRQLDRLVPTIDGIHVQDRRGADPRLVRLGADARS